MASLYQQLQNDFIVKDIIRLPYAKKSDILKSFTEKLALYQYLNPKVVDISIVGDNVHFSGLYTVKKLEEIRTQIKKSESCWITVTSSDLHSSKKLPGTKFFLYGGNLYYNGNSIGAVIISFSSESILTQLPAKEEMIPYYLLADSEGIIHSFNCKGTLGHTLFEFSDIKNLLTDRIHDGYQNNVRNYPYIIQSTYIRNMDCFLISALDIRQTDKDITSIKRLLFGCIFAITIFMFSIFLLINLNIIRPLAYFSNVIHSIRENKKQQLEKPLNLKGCTEMITIGNEFTNMLNDLNEMNKRIFRTTTTLYETELQKQTAEISYLRSQINPHFLYNTLELVRKMALDKNSPEIASISLDMGKIFRYSTKGKDYVALKEELAISEAYIRIQQTRFQSKIEVFYNFPDEVLELQVMKMLMQPIIENAIFHGLEPREDYGSLYIGASLKSNQLILTIRDNGIGIEPENLAALQSELISPVYDTSHHVGLINTNARIQLQYGTNYGLEIDSKPGDGTVINMKLPIVKCT
jgi:Predicted signal transduction protein with a C-terminal ATPase domain